MTGPEMGGTVTERRGRSRFKKTTYRKRMTSVTGRSIAYNDTSVYDRLMFVSATSTAARPPISAAHRSHQTLTNDQGIGHNYIGHNYIGHDK